MSADLHPKLSRGQVWCQRCYRTQKVDGSKAMLFGWPKCCGYTMTIDSPEERKALLDAALKVAGDPS